MFPPVVIGTLWQRSHPENDYISPRLRILTPSGKEIKSHTHEGLSFGKYQRYRINMNLGSFPVEEEGEYTFVIEHQEADKWIKDDDFPIQVEIIEKASPAKETE